MAITALGTDTTGTEQALDNSITVAYTQSAGANRVGAVKIGAWVNSGGVTVNTVTWGGVAMTLGVSKSQAGLGTDTYFSAIYYIKEADLPADGSKNIVVTFTTNIDEKAVVVCMRQDVDQSTTLRASNSTGGTSGTHPTVAVTTQAGDRVEVALTQYHLTPTSDDTEDTSAVASGDFTDCHSSHRDASGSSTTVGWTISTQEHAMVAASLIPAGGGGGGAGAQPTKSFIETRAAHRALEEAADAQFYGARVFRPEPGVTPSLTRIPQQIRQGYSVDPEATWDYAHTAAVFSPSPGFFTATPHQTFAFTSVAHRIEEEARDAQFYGMRLFRPAVTNPGAGQATPRKTFTFNIAAHEAENDLSNFLRYYGARVARPQVGTTPGAARRTFAFSITAQLIEQELADFPVYYRLRVMRALRARRVGDGRNLRIFVQDRMTSIVVGDRRTTIIPDDR